MSFDEEYYKELLKERLSEKRYRHSLSVQEEAVRLAKRYGADREKASLAGLLHDVMKDVPRDEQLKYCRDNDIMLTLFEEKEPKLLHAVTGAHYLRNALGIGDQEVLLAVRYHTTGRAGMSLLEKIIYLADFVEPLRSFEGVEPVRTVLREKGLDEALLRALDFSVTEVVSRESLLHSDTVFARNWILEERL